MEKFFTVNAEKQSIRCKIYCSSPRDTEAVVLYGHGFGGHMGNKAAERFAGKVIEKHKNAAVVTFNWPCHGEDIKKKLSIEDCMTYIRLMTAYIRENLHAEKLFCYATSFGGYLFLRYVAEYGSPFDKIVLRCPVTDMYNVMVHTIMSEDDMEILRKKKKVSVGFDRKIEITQDFLDEVKDRSVPGIDFMDYADDILILHGTCDEIVPCHETEQFADNNCIEFIPVEGADHRFVDPAKMNFANVKIMEFLGL